MNTRSVTNGLSEWTGNSLTRSLARSLARLLTRPLTHRRKLFPHIHIKITVVQWLNEETVLYESARGREFNSPTRLNFFSFFFFRTGNHCFFFFCVFVKIPYMAFRIEEKLNEASIVSQAVEDK